MRKFDPNGSTFPISVKKSLKEKRWPEFQRQEFGMGNNFVHFDRRGVNSVLYQWEYLNNFQKVTGVKKGRKRNGIKIWPKRQTDVQRTSYHFFLTFFDFFFSFSSVLWVIMTCASPISRWIISLSSQALISFSPGWWFSCHAWWSPSIPWELWNRGRVWALCTFPIKYNKSCLGRWQTLPLLQISWSELDFELVVHQGVVRGTNRNCKEQTIIGEGIGHEASQRPRVVLGSIHKDHELESTHHSMWVVKQLNTMVTSSFFNSPSENSARACGFEDTAEGVLGEGAKEGVVAVVVVREGSGEEEEGKLSEADELEVCDGSLQSEVCQSKKKENVREN